MPRFEMTPDEFFLFFVILFILSCIMSLNYAHKSIIDLKVIEYMKQRLYDVTELFKRSFSSSFSEEEKKKLESVLQDDFLRKVYEQLSDEEFVEEKFREFNEYEYKTAFEKLKQYRKRTILRRWTVWSASVAAVVALFLFFFLPREEKNVTGETIPAVAERVIPAGGKSAILKLADGRTVKIGQEPMNIKEEDGSMVTYEEGQLSYSSDTLVLKELFNELEVPRGGECQVQLDDGTKVWLNADSRLKYPVVFNGTERKVFLSGEAYFEVKKDAHPFIVSTDLGDVTVLGTSFGVSVYDGEVGATTLVSGKVKFTLKDGTGETLSPGEQITVSESGQMEKRMVNVEEYVGWRSGLFVFKNKTLEAIMSMFERWYDVEIVFQDDALRDLKFTGDLERYDSINTFLQLLERLNEIKYEIKGATIMLFK